MLPTNFQIFKNKHKSQDKHPDYKISYKNEHTGKYEEIGAGWKKTITSTGENYISCKLNINPAPTGLTEAEKENIRILKEKELKAQQEKAEMTFNNDF